MKIKVKIAVAANAEGHWHAYGYAGVGGESWDEIMDAFDALESEHRFWVEAVIDVPDEIPTVQGTVETATLGEGANHEGA